MSRREASKNETRRLIIAAARKLFLEKELSRCTMRAIGKEAGVSAATVVVHFKSKNALMEAALTDDIERTTAKALATLPSDGDLSQRLNHIWQSMYTFYALNRTLYRTLLRSTIFEPESDTPALTSEANAFFVVMEEMIEEEKAVGRMDSSVDGYIMARALFAQYFGTLILFYRDPSMTPEAAAELVLALNRQTLAGLMAT